MRTVRIVGICLLLTAVAASAARAQGRSMGIRLGTSIATLDVAAQDLLDAEDRTGRAAGVFYERSIGLLGYQLEILYTKRGAELGRDGSLEISYLTIPALLKVGLPMGLLRPSMFGGVALAVEVDCELVRQTPRPCDDASGIDVNGTDWSTVVGAELEIGAAGVGLVADGRYYVGLSDIGEFEGVAGDVKSRSWEFTAGFGIPIP